MCKQRLAALSLSCLVLWMLIGYSPSPAQSTKDKAPSSNQPEDDADREQRQLQDQLVASLEKTPRRGPTLDRIYGYQVERGTLEQFLKKYRARTEQNPKDGAAWMVLGLMESQRGKDADAVAAFTQAEQLLPTEPLASYYLGQVLVLVGRPGEAVAALERAIARKPDRKEDLLDFYQALGRVHQRAAQPEKALAVWQQLESQFPDNIRVQEQIAAALAEEGQFEQAIVRYEALAKNPKNTLKAPLLRLEAAELRMRKGDRDQALADFERLLADLPDDGWLFRDAQRRLEEVFLRHDDLAGLVKYYEDVLAKKPNDVTTMARLAHALILQGRAAPAQEWLKKALARAAKRSDLRLVLIEQLVQAQDWPQALAQYELLDKNDPNNPDFLREWGRLHLKDTTRPEPERRQAAAVAWRKLLPAPGKRQDPTAIAQVADLFRQAGMDDDALTLYKQAVELAPDRAQYRIHLGEFYHSRGRTQEALATWKALAEGARMSAKSLQNLAEVLSSFGYHSEAVVALADASGLAPQDLALRLQYADSLRDAERYADALQQLDQAARLVAKPEEAEDVLAAQIKVHQAAGTVSAEIGRLTDSLTGWQRDYQVARYQEAARQWPEASAAIRRALAQEKELTESKRLAYAVAAAARIYEGDGNLQAAADACRKLVSLDRSARTEYLTQIARLEAKLGRRAEALQAGRDLIQAAPGNNDHYRFFADLCFQLGEAEEGLATLRRAVRINPNDPDPLTALAKALADLFRTDEGIELYWRAFDKADQLGNLDGQTAAVTRLTELYLRNNQFDRLVERLNRLRRESTEKLRPMTLCLAQAYQTAGDLGTARQELEGLLTANTTDTHLLGQLAALADREGDLQAAIRFQRLLVKAAPKDNEPRLALFLVRAGEVEEAVNIWLRLASGEKESDRLFEVIDTLLVFHQYERALPLVERVLRDQPRDWEALYRHGMVLAHLDRSLDAAKSFQAILDLRLPDDELSVVFQANKKKAAKAAPKGPARPRRAGAQPAQKPPDFPLLDRIQVADAVRFEAGLTTNYGAARRYWSPGDFGQARMAAVAWRVSLAQKDNRLDEFLASVRPTTDANLHVLWDWWYLQYVRHDYEGRYELVKTLAQHGDLTEKWLYLWELNVRPAVRQRQFMARNNPDQPDGDDGVPPLPPDERELVFLCLQTVRQRQPEWLTSELLTNLAADLRRIKQPDYEQRVLDELLAATEAANRPQLTLDLIELESKRKDIDGTLKLFLALATSQGNQTKQSSTWKLAYTTFASVSLARLMQARADAGAFRDVEQILDFYLDYRRGKKSGASRPREDVTRVKTQSLLVWSGKVSTYLPIYCALPNAHYDIGAILLLRNAFEYFKRGDRLEELFDHFQPALKGTDQDRLYAHLALAYLHWWNEEKEKAVVEFGRACEAAGGDQNLRLELAELHEDLGRFDQALRIVDDVIVVDQKLMQQRESTALRLAVRLGNDVRAKQAAERLFGLRLDTETQIQLAGQMQQLGMHEMAEAVLCRARVQAGNRIAALVSLLQQYQNKPEMGLQVAYQILRHTPAIGGVAGPGQPRSEEDSARALALQTLARSGKVQELIDRVERQLKTSPRSITLHQTLIDYYTAAGKKDKTRALYERMAELKPGDGQLRYYVATQLQSAGATDAALAHFQAAIKAQPSLFYAYDSTIIPIFQKAEKLEELAKTLESLPAGALGAHEIGRVAGQLLAKEPTRALGLRLFRKGWDAFTEQRSNLFYNLSEEAWQLPEIYDSARQMLIPAKGKPLANPWHGADYSMGQVLAAATQQNRLEELRHEVEAELPGRPTWLGGKAILAVLQVRQGLTEEPRTSMQVLMADKQNPLPFSVRQQLGNELLNVPALRDLAMSILESGIDEWLAEEGADFRYGGTRQLVSLYQSANRIADARALLLKSARALASRRLDPRRYEERTRLQNLVHIGNQLTDLGYPLDGLRIHADLLRDIPQLRDTYDGSQIEYAAVQGLARDRQSLSTAAQKHQAATPARLAAANTLRTVAETGRVDQPQGAPPRVPIADFGLVLLPRGLDRITLHSLLADAARLSFTEPGVLAEAQSRCMEASKANPGNLSLRMAAVLLAVVRRGGTDDAEASKAAVADLVEAVKRTPLEELASGSYPTSRQRKAAAEQLSLWIVSRECRKHVDLREAAIVLAARALEAARRQADPDYYLAMLRQAGQEALDRGDRAEAERQWMAMLDFVLADPTRGKLGPGGGSGKGTSPGVGDARRTTYTTNQWEQAAQIARLAAPHLPGLSLRAVRAALAEGPPVPAAQAARQNLSSQAIGATLAELDLLWQRYGVAPADVYDTLARIVLPDSREGDLFFYPQSAGVSSRGKPRSAGQMLVEWAVRANRGDDLGNRLTAREGRPLAAVTARTLAVQLALAKKDWAAAAAALDWLAERLEKDRLRNTAELSCHAAIPALDVAATRLAALRVAERAARNLTGPGAANELHLLLARVYFEAANVAEGRRHMQEYLKLAESPMNRGNRFEDNDFAYRRGHQLMSAAQVYVRAQQWDDAWEVLGQYADLPIQRTGGALASGVLAAMATALAPGVRGQESGVRGQAGSALTPDSRLLIAESYPLLKSWTLPAENRRTCRIVTAFVAEDLPPAPFGAWKLPQRGGVISTAELLIAAARDTGKLDELAAELEPLAEKKVQNAALLYQLTQIARGQAASVAPKVEGRLADLRKRSGSSPFDEPWDDVYFVRGPNGVWMPRRRSTGEFWSDYLLARACISSESRQLRTSAEQLLNVLIDQVQQFSEEGELPQLRRDLAAAAVSGQKPGFSEKPGFSDHSAQCVDPGLALWDSVSHHDAGRHAAGAPPTQWAEHEGHVVHLTGPHRDFLYFAYPLAGNFTLEFEARNSGAPGYAGLVFDAGQSVWPAGYNEFLSRTSGFVNGSDFSRYTLEVTPGKVRVFVGGHLFYEDADPSPSNPWLALYAPNDRQTVFRHITLSGSPTIPREVPLTPCASAQKVEGGSTVPSSAAKAVGAEGSDRLEGWIADFYGETQPPRRTIGQTTREDGPFDTPEVVELDPRPDAYDWSMRDGLIVGRRVPVTGAALQQSRLFYYRPLRSGERIKYEFYYDPDSIMTHPSLGRLVFLLEPAGVRLHWMTDGPDDWTGLTVDNAVTEAASQKGPKPLPLQPKAWNIVQIALAGDQVTLTLNDAVIYERKLDVANDRLFGFFHYKDRTAVQVRNVVLQGDWPEKLTPEQLANLTARRTPASAGALRVNHTLVTENTLLQDADAVLRQAKALPPGERYAFLKAWVLPSDRHPTVRLAGSFTPFDPPPTSAVSSQQSAVSNQRGGAFAAPALVLVATAKELGRIPELATAAGNVATQNPEDQRAQTAFLALLRIAEANDGEAGRLLDQLVQQMAKVPEDGLTTAPWPEFTAGVAALDRSTLHAPAQALWDALAKRFEPRKPDPAAKNTAKRFYPGRVFDSGESWPQGLLGENSNFARQVRHFQARAQLLGASPTAELPWGAHSAVAGWTPVTHSSAASCGAGLPPPLWTFQNGEWRYYPGHQADALYFGVPLVGDFEVRAEVSAGERKSLALSYAGRHLVLGAEGKNYSVMHYTRSLRTGGLQPPLTAKGDWLDYRLAVKNSVVTVTIDGRKIYEEHLPALSGQQGIESRSRSDPWLAFHAPSSRQAAFRNLRITGAPRVPESIDLSAASDLTGWLAHYYDESVAIQAARWEKNGPEIHSPANPASRGSKQESLLQYHRPLLEDGELEYEFYYDPDQAMTHPALGRLAFLLESQGVKIHWLTDGLYDRTGLSPENVAEEPANRRGSYPLPLKPRDWNHVKLVLAGNKVSLLLNNAAIYERELEPTNPRIFGLFHYADETEVRVRNVRYRGQWPRKVSGEQ